MVKINLLNIKGFRNETLFLFHFLYDQPQLNVMRTFHNFKIFEQNNIISVNFF
jgi:hypothetical protein